MIHGKNLLAITNIGGTRKAVGGCKSCGLDVSQEVLSACSPTDGRTKVKIQTSYDWSVSCGCLMVNSSEAFLFLNALINKTVITLEFIVAGFKVKGDAVVTSWRVGGDIGNMAKFDVQFEGSGPLTDASGDGWDYHAGDLYTYSSFETDTLDLYGTLEDGSMQHISES